MYIMNILIGVYIMSINRKHLASFSEMTAFQYNQTGHVRKGT